MLSRNAADDDTKLADAVRLFDPFLMTAGERERALGVGPWESSLLMPACDVARELSDDPLDRRVLLAGAL